MAISYIGIRYIVTQNKRNWTVRVDNYPIVGAGSRPELAIRDWKEQYRRWLKTKPLTLGR